MRPLSPQLPLSDPSSHWVTQLHPARAARRTPKLSVPQATMPGMNVTAVLLAMITLAAGFAAGWAMARSRTAAPHAERKGPRAGRDAARTEVAQVRAERDALTQELRI